MTYSIASESLGGGVCFQACLLVCKGLDLCFRRSFDDVTRINFRFRHLVTWSSPHGRGASSHMIFCKISLSSPKLLTYFRNSKWRPPPSWIFRLYEFGHSSVLLVWYLCSVPNLVQISVTVTEIDAHMLQRFIWSRHANLLPVSTFGHVVISASPWCICPYNVMQDIFIQSTVIDIFPKFKMAAAAILGFQFMWISQFRHVDSVLFVLCTKFGSNNCYPARHPSGDPCGITGTVSRRYLAPVSWWYPAGKFDMYSCA